MNDLTNLEENEKNVLIICQKKNIIILTLFVIRIIHCMVQIFLKVSLLFYLFFINVAVVVVLNQILNF